MHMTCRKHLGILCNIVDSLENLKVSEVLSQRTQLVRQIIADAECLKDSEDIQLRNLINECLKDLNSFWTGSSVDYIDILIERFKNYMDILKENLIDREYQSFIIGTDIQSFRNLYIFLLCHPDSYSSVGDKIISRIKYLDKMTRNVIFIMPGYRRDENDDQHFTFDEDLFIRMVQDLENKSSGLFTYTDGCELLIVGSDEESHLDFNFFKRIDLNQLSKTTGVEPVTFILSIAARLKEDMNSSIDRENFVSQALSGVVVQEVPKSYKVFIAGSKTLKEERAMLREELSKVENRHNLDIRSLTFEDFPESLTGSSGGRQAQYNKYIREEADVVIFIFANKAGEITAEEFDVAYESLMKDNHPDIFIYVRHISRMSIRNLLPDKVLRQIKEKVSTYNREYYIEYENKDDLRYRFYKDMEHFFAHTE